MQTWGVLKQGIEVLGCKKQDIDFPLNDSYKPKYCILGWNCRKEVLWHLYTMSDSQRSLFLCLQHRGAIWKGKQSYVQMPWAWLLASAASKLCFKKQITAKLRWFIILQLPPPKSPPLPRGSGPLLRHRKADFQQVNQCLLQILDSLH